MKPTPIPDQPDKNERDIRRIMVIGTAIGVGCMAASLESLRASPSGFSFQITIRTFVAFVLAAALMIPFWRIAFEIVSGKQVRSRHIWAALLILVLGIAAFLYPLRFVPANVRPDLFTGLILAIFALSVLAFILVRIVKFLNADDARHDDTTKPAGEPQA